MGYSATSELGLPTTPARGPSVASWPMPPISSLAVVQAEVFVQIPFMYCKTLVVFNVGTYPGFKLQVVMVAWRVRLFAP